MKKLDLFEVFEQMEMRPGMYFASPISLPLIDAFLIGYLLGADKKRIVAGNGMDFQYFNSWLTGALPPTMPEEYGWRARIEHVSGNDKGSVDLFFSLMRQFATGKLKVEHEETEPKALKWSRGTGDMKLEEYQDIEEIVVRFEIITHEFSETKFRIGYNENDFRVYVEPFIGENSLHTLRFTEIEENY